MRVLATIAAVVLAVTPASAFEILSSDQTENYWASICVGKKKPAYEFSHCSSITRFVAKNERGMQNMRARSMMLAFHIYEPDMSRIKITFGSSEWRLQKGQKFTVNVQFKDGHYTLKDCVFDGSSIGCQAFDPKLVLINDIAMKDKIGLMVADRNGVWDLGWFSLKGSLASLTKTIEGIHRFYKDKPIRFGPPSQQHDG